MREPGANAGFHFNRRGNHWRAGCDSRTIGDASSITHADRRAGRPIADDGYIIHTQCGADGSVANADTLTHAHADNYADTLTHAHAYDGSASPC